MRRTAKVDNRIAVAKLITNLFFNSGCRNGLGRLTRSIKSDSWAIEQENCTKNIRMKKLVGDGHKTFGANVFGGQPIVTVLFICFS